MKFFNRSRIKMMRLRNTGLFIIIILLEMVVSQQDYGKFLAMQQICQNTLLLRPTLLRYNSPLPKYAIK
jgi:hypothetical protein